MDNNTLNTNKIELINEADTARLLGLSIHTLRTWASRKKGPARIKVGKQVFYRNSALNDWLIEQETFFSKNNSNK